MRVKLYSYFYRKSKQACGVIKKNNEPKDNQTNTLKENVMFWDTMGLDHVYGNVCSTETSKASSISSVAVPNIIFYGKKFGKPTNLTFILCCKRQLGQIPQPMVTLTDLAQC